MWWRLWLFAVWQMSEYEDSDNITGQATRNYSTVTFSSRVALLCIRQSAHLEDVIDDGREGHPPIVRLGVPVTKAHLRNVRVVGLELELRKNVDNFKGR